MFDFISVSPELDGFITAKGTIFILNYYKQCVRATQISLEAPVNDFFFGGLKFTVHDESQCGREDRKFCPRQYIDREGGLKIHTPGTRP
jgi:hypothetical protein